MKNPKRKAFIGGFVLVLLFLVLFVTLPYLLAGPPTPLFTVRNHGAGTHEIRVEVFDSENNSLLDETFDLAAGQGISRPKPSRALVPGFDIVDCTFKFTLDGRFTETHITNIQPWNTVDVELYADYAQGQPLFISEITV